MKTGKRYTEDLILKTLQREANGVKIRDICRDAGASEQTFFRWKQKYNGMDQPMLSHAKQLERENARLKRLLAERDLEIDAIKEVLQKKF